ncbi:unnamed protein product [Rhizoctonia solani]|uniref:C2H2-type domain-containing protein n=1 Tax=Rhizoctonia solani TaxID=456999 RepID=A0A8H3E927_9AGAM|nr:unnamed protein product [Rhizoctonia solani]
MVFERSNTRSQQVAPRAAPRTCTMSELSWSSSSSHDSLASSPYPTAPRVNMRKPRSQTPHRVSEPQGTYLTMGACVAQVNSALDCLLPSQRESGRGKGLDVMPLGRDILHYRAPIEGEEMRMSGRNRSEGHHNGIHSGLIPRDRFLIGTSESIWDASSGSYDLQGAGELYDQDMVEPLTAGLEDPLSQLYWHSDTPSVPNLPDQLQAGIGSHELYHGSAHASYLIHNQTTPAHTHRPDQTVPSSINCQDPGTFTARLDPTAYRQEHYSYDYSRQSIAPLSPIRTHLDPSMPAGSEPQSPGGNHRSRRPNVCHICGKEVRRPGVLEDHVNSHTGHRPHECPYCPRVFTTKSNMQRHVGNFHGSGVGR